MLLLYYIIMIYLVSKNKTLFGSTRYSEISFNGAINILRSLGKLIQLDTETTGLDEHTKKILTIQLGTKKHQVVFDWTTMTIEERAYLKEFLDEWNGVK